METHFPQKQVVVAVTPVELAIELLAEARRTNGRRLLALAGERSACVSAGQTVLDALDVGISDTVAISGGDEFCCETVPANRSTEIMGTTRTIVVVDLHNATIPNVIGRATGAVDGGGLLVFLVPSLETWPSTRDAFDEGLVVAPYTLEDVEGRFKRRLVDTLGDHPGVAIVDADSESAIRQGLTGGEPEESSESFEPSSRGERFPSSLYERCLTQDQARVVESFEGLYEHDTAVVVSAERGRGKSSAAGLAAGAFLTDGASVVVTAPARANTRELFARAREVTETELVRDSPSTLEHASGGSISYREPIDAIDCESVDVVFVDEAAGLPVVTLERLLDASRIAFTTTRHGYEGAGHGFSVRFRETLSAASKQVNQVQMTTPIRYAPDDPIESWANRALLLDARPVVDEAIRGATPESVEFRRIPQASLESSEQTLREVLGLLATAHYRTQPDDLARILDAPNLEVVVLEEHAHVACVALLAREGGLSAEQLASAYRGERLRGNMLPDIFINGLRDAGLAATPGLRIVRIATHPALRRRGLGSTLLETIREEPGVEWIGTGFGATPDLVRFWAKNAFVPVSLSASRNRASGAHSVVMIDTDGPTTPTTIEYADALPDRLGSSLSDVHRTVEPDVVIELFRALPRAPSLEISAAGWKHLTAAADGPGRYDLYPRPARELAMHHLQKGGDLTRTQGRLLVLKVLQGHPWETVTEELEYASVADCRRALGTALSVLLDRYGGDEVREERRRLNASTELVEPNDDSRTV